MKDKYTESFEDFYENYQGYENAVEKDEKDYYASSKVSISRDTFTHQQSKINELLERLKECEESLGFYANDKTSWDASKIIPQDREQFGTGVSILIGGKRARLYFKKYEGKNEHQ